MLSIFVLDPELLATTAIVLIRGVHRDLAYSFFPFQRLLSEDWSQEKLSSSELLRDFKPAEVKGAVIPSISELGSAVPRSLALVLVDGHPLGT